MRYGSEISTQPPAACTRQPALFYAHTHLGRRSTRRSKKSVANLRTPQASAGHLDGPRAAHHVRGEDRRGHSPAPGGGNFDVSIHGAPIWSRAAERPFPDIKKMKQLVPPPGAPGKSLRH